MHRPKTNVGENMSCSAALDTSCNASLAVKRGQEILLRETLACGGRNSDRELVPWLLSSLTAAGFELADIDKWTVGIGPGSYSGIRAGIALVRGIARGTNAHCRGIPSSRALARQVRPEFDEGARLAVLHDGRRNQLIVSLYQVQRKGLRSAGPPKLMNPEDACERASQWHGVVTPHGQELSAVLETLRERTRIFAIEHVDAAELLLAGGGWPSEPSATEAGLAPIYVRPAVFTAPKKLRTPYPAGNSST